MYYLESMILLILLALFFIRKERESERAGVCERERERAGVCV